ncbi:hypothetical protein HY630_01695 [Candidatus Uhrbacteria bacterium]|nr:hypothetical protein [Candidatus Uhrbacteria bacterium]
MHEDKVIEKLIEHDAKLDSLIPLVEEFREFRQEVTSTNEKMLTIMKRLDEDRHFIAAWIQRVEDDLRETKKTVSLHEIELRAVKQRLAM